MEILVILIGFIVFAYFLWPSKDEPADVQEPGEPISFDNLPDWVKEKVADVQEQFNVKEVLAGLKKAELIEFARANNIDVKNSWTKTKIIEAILENSND